ncbi:MAG: DNA polymerase III subunit gamma/tau [Phycisphaerae bacterium]
MSYTVLARKYRSQTFDEVVGQGAVVATLRNAISHGRIHHGYLFCGTRGVGKTSLARIFAKSLNCLSSDGPTLTPCNACDSCKLVSEGEDIDVIEIDAASNTGVDDVRVLRSNTVLRPARSRFKIYIIDEVHMLSRNAFNALLKTLEEPPGHVKFILATTNPQDVPATIQSRVQRFEFSPLSLDEIAGQLARICDAEQVRAEPDALRRIARLANGSMRDALSLADQLLSLYGQELTQAALADALPAAHDELLAELIDRIADGDAAGALAAADRGLARGEGAEQWCGRLALQFRDLMMVRVCGAATELVDANSAVRERLAVQAARFDAGTYVYAIAVLDELRRAVRNSGTARALVDAAMVRLAEAAKFSAIETLLARLDGSPAGAAPSAAAASAESAPVRGATPVPPRLGATAPAAAPDKKKVTTPGALPAAERAAPRGAEAVEPAAAPVDRTRREDLEAAYAQPLVQDAIDVLGGQLMSVGRRPAGGGAPRGAETRPAE